jgi:hypothetical protein
MLRRFTWHFFGAPTVIITTNVGFKINKYAKFSKDKLYVTDIVGRITLNQDGTTDQLFATSWDWAPWCNIMRFIDDGMKTHWIGRLQARDEM